MLYCWRAGDPLPSLPPLAGFSAAASDDVAQLAAVAGVPDHEVLRRIRQGDRAYLARIGPTVVGYGWSAHERASIGELGIHSRLPAGEHYLWDFATLPRYRGQGVYPRLLQAILRLERAMAHRFWIGHDRDNEASRRGILKAGFRPVGGLARLASGGWGFVPCDPCEGQRAAALLGVPLVVHGQCPGGQTPGTLHERGRPE